LEPQNLWCKTAIEISSGYGILGDKDGRLTGLAKKSLIYLTEVGLNIRMQ